MDAAAEKLRNQLEDLEPYCGSQALKFAVRAGLQPQMAYTVSETSRYCLLYTSRCHGTGYVTTVQRSFLGQVQSSSPCPDCHGEGTVIDHPCETCDGQGRTPSHEKIDIDIPAGVSTGRQLRVSGFGEAGLRGEPSGDLIVNVRVADHERFKRNGDDLYLVSDISIAQAALGCEIEVEGIMPDEVVKVCVPAGTQ